jgi:hypothetical protein
MLIVIIKLIIAPIQILALLVAMFVRIVLLCILILLVVLQFVLPLFSWPVLTMTMGNAEVQINDVVSVMCAIIILPSMQWSVNCVYSGINLLPMHSTWS